MWLTRTRTSTARPRCSPRSAHERRVRRREPAGRAPALYGRSARTTCLPSSRCSSTARASTSAASPSHSSFLWRCREAHSGPASSPTAADRATSPARGSPSEWNCHRGQPSPRLFEELWHLTTKGCTEGCTGGRFARPASAPPPSAADSPGPEQLSRCCLRRAAGPRFGLTPQSECRSTGLIRLPVDCAARCAPAGGRPRVTPECGA